MGIIEGVMKEEFTLAVSHYLPHRPVIKETSSLPSMKIRLFFDVSTKVPNFPSLNDCLETGINYIETIPSILIKFHLNKIGVISDIRRTFLQISLHKKGRKFLRFIWYSEKDAIKILRHARCVFGVTSIPCLLMAVIHHLLSTELLKVQYSEELLEKLHDSFYVDISVSSVHNIFELDNFVKSAIDIMKEENFDLRGWESIAFPETSLQILKAHILGLIWDKNF